MVYCTRILLVIFGLTMIAACQTTAQLGEPAAQPAAGHRLAEIHTRLGVGYMKEGQYELAWKRLQRALEIDPGYSTAHNAMGVLYEDLNNPEKAEQHFRRAVELNPGDSDAQANLGSFLCRHGRHDEGEQHFLHALRNPLYSNPAIAHANAGLCMNTAGDADKAETYLRQALRHNTKLPMALILMSELSLDKDRPLPARAYLQRYLEVSPHTARSLWLGIRIERALGDKNAVSSYAMLLKANHPDSEEARLLLESEEH